MKRFTWESTPLVNIVQDNAAIMQRLMSGDLSNQVMEMHRAPHKLSMKSVEFHKYHLGRQDFCWNGSEHRQWIWEGKNWRVFVANFQGIAFEVREGLTGEQTLQAWDDYRRRVMLLQLKPGTLVHVYSDDQLVKVEYPDPRSGGHYIVTAMDGSQEQMSVSVDNIKESE